MVFCSKALRSVALLLVVVVVEAAEKPSSGSKTPPESIVAAPLHERLRGAYPNWVTGKLSLWKEAVQNDFRKEVVDSRDRLMQQLPRWASALAGDRNAGVLVFEVVTAQDAYPVRNYRRVLIGCADDKTWASLERLDNQHAVRLDSRSWQLMKGYVSDAAGAGIVGSFGQRGGYGFDVILLAYFDEHRWQVSDYREYTIGGSDDTPGVKKLFRLAYVLHDGLGIVDTELAGYGEILDVSETIEKLKTIRERSKTAPPPHARK